jgi:hypothetical protein
MRKIVLLLAAICLVVSSFAAFTLETPPLKASEVFITIGKNGEKISLLDLSRMTVKDLQQLTGKKMKFFDKLAFKRAQKQLKNNINYDGTFNSKKIEKFITKGRGDGEGFQAGGFFLGFLLGLIGILIAYLIKDDQKRNRVKWAWIGFGAWIAILLVLIAAGGGMYY